MLGSFATLVLFGVTCLAVLRRPFGIGGGWWSMGAAALALVTGLVGAGAAWGGLGATVEVLVYFAGLILITAAVGWAGALEVVLDRIEAWAAGRPRHLVLGVLLATAAVTVLFSNDAAALLLAPSLGRRLRARKLPSARLLVGVAVMANAASLVLPISNPVNLLVLERDRIALSAYLSQVSPAALAAVVLAGLVLTPLLARGLACGSPPSPGACDRATLGGLGLLLVGLLVADLASGAQGLSLGPPTLAAGVLAVAWCARRRRNPLNVLRGARWSLLPLVAGLAVLSSGLGGPGPVGAIGGVLAAGGGAAAEFRVGVATALAAALINNLPAAFLATAGAGALGHLALGVPVIVGADLGANLAPAGSLSTIIIFGADPSPGDRGRWRHFWTAGWLVGPLGLGAALGVVALGR